MAMPSTDVLGHQAFIAQDHLKGGRIQRVGIAEVAQGKDDGIARPGLEVGRQAALQRALNGRLQAGRHHDVRHLGDFRRERLGHVQRHRHLDGRSARLEHGHRSGYVVQVRDDCRVALRKLRGDKLPLARIRVEAVEVQRVERLGAGRGIDAQGDRTGRLSFGVDHIDRAFQYQGRRQSTPCCCGPVLTGCSGGEIRRRDAFQ
jgi:hypothetical protein